MKKIPTTYTMRLEVIKLLKKAVKKTKRRKEVIITLAIREMLKDQKKYQREGGRIENQARFDEETGLPIPKKRVKVRFLEREYLYFQDAKRVFLRSISHIIAIAIFTHLEKIIALLLTIKDGSWDFYPFCNYAIIEKRIENITTFHIWWGVPPNVEILLQK